MSSTKYLPDPESYREFRETGPWSLLLCCVHLEHLDKNYSEPLCFSSFFNVTVFTEVVKNAIFLYSLEVTVWLFWHLSFSFRVIPQQNGKLKNSRCLKVALCGSLLSVISTPWVPQLLTPTNSQYLKWKHQQHHQQLHLLPRAQAAVMAAVWCPHPQHQVLGRMYCQTGEG